MKQQALQYNQITSLLRGVPTDQNQNQQKQLPYDYKTSSVTEDYHKIERGLQANTHIPGGQAEEYYRGLADPVSIQVTAPDGTHNDSAFQQQKGEWEQRVNTQNSEVSQLKQTNGELVSQLQSLALQLDSLITQADNKTVVIQKKINQNLPPQYACNHESEIEIMKNKLALQESAMQKSYNRVGQQVAVKDREIINAKNKVITAKKELAQLKNKQGQSEVQNIGTLTQKIKQIQNNNKELQQELVQMKNIQRTHQKSLQMIEKDYAPKQFMGQIEDIRNLQNKAEEYEGKIKNDERQIEKLDEQFQNAQKRKTQLITELENIGNQHQPAQRTEKEELIDDLIKLEEEVNEKKKEFEILQFKHDDLLQKGNPNIPKRGVRGSQSQQNIPTIHSNRSGSLQESTRNLSKLQPLNQGIYKNSPANGRSLQTIQPNKGSKINSISKNNVYETVQTSSLPDVLNSRSQSVQPRSHVSNPSQLMANRGNNYQVSENRQPQAVKVRSVSNLRGSNGSKIGQGSQNIPTKGKKSQTIKLKQPGMVKGDHPYGNQ